MTADQTLREAQVLEALRPIMEALGAIKDACEVQQSTTVITIDVEALAERLAARDRAVAKATGEREREQWVDRLTVLCDDEWLRRRDRAMELPGVKGHRWERRASSAWEQAANGVRAVLNDLANYSEEYGGRHESYMRWLRAGRDEGTAREEGRA